MFKHLTSSPTHGGPSTTMHLFENNLIPNSDKDGDSLHDQWEIYYFGGTEVEPWQDSDGDGASNEYEFKHGLNPVINDNIFTFSPKIVVNPNVIEISWPANREDSFEVEITNDIQEGVWIKSPTPVQIRGELAIFQHAKNDSLLQFYRIVKLTR